MPPWAGTEARRRRPARLPAVALAAVLLAALAGESLAQSLYTGVTREQCASVGGVRFTPTSTAGRVPEVGECYVPPSADSGGSGSGGGGSARRRGPSDYDRAMAALQIGIGVLQIFQALNQFAVPQRDFAAEARRELEKLDAYIHSRLGTDHAEEERRAHRRQGEAAHARGHDLLGKVDYDGARAAFEDARGRFHAGHDWENATIAERNMDLARAAQAHRLAREAAAPRPTIAALSADNPFARRDPSSAPRAGTGSSTEGDTPRVTREELDQAARRHCGHLDASGFSRAACELNAKAEHLIANDGAIRARCAGEPGQARTNCALNEYRRLTALAPGQCVGECGQGAPSSAPAPSGGESGASRPRTEAVRRPSDLPPFVPSGSRPLQLGPSVATAPTEGSPPPVTIPTVNPSGVASPSQQRVPETTPPPSSLQNRDQPYCQPSAEARAFESGQPLPPEQLALAQVNVQDRLRKGCFDPPLQAEVTRSPDEPRRHVVGRLWDEEAKDRVSPRNRIWTSPDGKPYLIPKNWALYRDSLYGPLQLVPYGSRPEIPERWHIPATAVDGSQCGQLGLGYVSPWCEEQRHLREVQNRGTPPRSGEQEVQEILEPFNRGLEDSRSGTAR